MKLLVSGSRTANNEQDKERIETELEALNPEELLTGGAKGADEIAEAWAKQKGIKITTIKPDYKRHGKAATHIRNDELLKKADKVLCYYATNNGTKTAGTASVAKKAAKMRKLLKEVYRTPQKEVDLFSY